MAKKMSPLGIMNAMGAAADEKSKKSSAPKEDAPEETGAKPKLKGKQIAAIKGKAK